MADVLIDAVKENDVPLIKELIERGVDVNIGGQTGESALYWAAMKGFVGCVQVLLEANADVHKATRGGWTPLHMASCTGRVECGKVRYFFVFPNEKKHSHFRCCSFSWNGRPT